MIPQISDTKYHEDETEEAMEPTQEEKDQMIDEYLDEVGL